MQARNSVLQVTLIVSQDSGTQGSTRLHRHESPRHYTASADQPPVAPHFLPGAIEVGVLALFDREHRRITQSADLQNTQRRPVYGARRSERRSFNEIAERHAHGEELGQGYQQIVGGSVDAQRVHVAADDIGEKTLLHHSSGSSETERTHSVPDIEDHSAFPGQQRLFADATANQRGVGEGSETMRKNVTCTQALKDFLKVRGRQVDMRHNG